MIFFTKKRKKQQGIAAVEMVVVLPIFLLLLAIVIEISNILIEYSIITKQQQVAARYLSEMHQFIPPAQIVNIGQNLVVFNNLNGLGNPVLPNLLRDQVEVLPQDRTLTITTDYRYQAIVFPSIPDFSNSNAPGIDTEFTLSATIQVTRL